MNFFVLGSPIKHSLSPVIHHAFAKQFNIKLCYQKKKVELSEIKEVLQALQKNDTVKGLNITAPLKEAVFQYVEGNCSIRAKQAKAVNTLQRTDNDWYGDNTDGIGLVTGIIKHHGISLTGKKILILGAGGATRGILGAILDQIPESILIANRTVNKADDLAKEFGGCVKIETSDYLSLAGLWFDVIIHATSVGFSGQVLELPKSILEGKPFCYDLNYGEAADPFLRWCALNGDAQISNGLGMLVEQAAEGFYLWHNVMPNTIEIIEKLQQTKNKLCLVI